MVEGRTYPEEAEITAALAVNGAGLEKRLALSQGDVGGVDDVQRLQGVDEVGRGVVTLGGGSRSDGQEDGEGKESGLHGELHG